ncbi:hypothetical protein, unlikely [Trypanosoma brucei gambiense DAL972]|uniref:T. brucei spp.-specific protein n=1 Tax=Trypanosoma brucei gambiense (strain MHOM/CI/86/DAL972) TaxID=679716 RepID=C9ZXK8_TRYB9|nr:hypothetical protein, unlikely [Trypanosoma brucei gambiense DAL972]CBH14152.1 hypothetical protein, unlikely [Trypanosoma brucei gambiense DAL972]|eukprot:XP_011776423.1 hypothetical protein, unlikely [Trypanosoma brucei gambiense DAL972]
MMTAWFFFLPSLFLFLSEVCLPPKIYKYPNMQVCLYLCLCLYIYIFIHMYEFVFFIDLLYAPALSLVHSLWIHRTTLATGTSPRRIQLREKQNKNIRHYGEKRCTDSATHVHA